TAEEQPDEPELYATVSMSAVSVPAADLVADEGMEPSLAEQPADVMHVSFEAADQVEAPEAEAMPDAQPIPEAEAMPDAQPMPEVEPMEGEPTPEADVAPEPPHELVAAPDSPYSTEVVEPDWFADGDFTWLEAA